MNEYIFMDDCPPDDFVERGVPCLETTSAMVPYLSRLEVKLLESGYTGSQIRRLTKTAAGLGRYLDWRGIGLADAGSAELEEYSAYCGRTRSGRRTEYNTGLSTIQAFLKPYGILSRPETPTAADPWLSAFEQHERSVRGLKDNTIASYRHFLLPFVLGLCKDGAPEWTALNGPYVSRFITTDLAIRRASRRTMVAGVRNFLRFLIFKGLISRGVLRAIPKIRSWRYSGLPEPLTTEEHELVLKACQSESAGTRRDRAFIALLAVLGVRGIELRTLRLEDIDWREGVIRVRCAKTNRERILPLPKLAGALLADYIQHERPQSVFREVFLTKLSPRVPFGCAAASYLVHQFLGRIGIRGARLGSHSFRHTAATLMVRNGATIKQVADILGHQSIATTQIYVKLDEPSLKGVALAWPGGDL